MSQNTFAHILSILANHKVSFLERKHTPRSGAVDFVYIVMECKNNMDHGAKTVC